MLGVTLRVPRESAREAMRQAIADAIAIPSANVTITSVRGFPSSGGLG